MITLKQARKDRRVTILLSFAGVIGSIYGLVITVKEKPERMVEQARSAWYADRPLDTHVLDDQALEQLLTEESITRDSEQLAGVSVGTAIRIRELRGTPLDAAWEQELKRRVPGAVLRYPSVRVDSPQAAREAADERNADSPKSTGLTSVLDPADAAVE